MNYDCDRPLGLDLVRDPSTWALSLRVSPSRLDVAAYSPSQADTLIYRSVPLPAPGHAALAEAVYAHPLLTAPFGRVRVVAETPRAMAVPACAASDDDAATLLEAVWPGAGLRPVADAVPALGAVVLMGIEPETLSFLGRTFPDVALESHLGALCRHLGARAGFGNGSRMLAVFRDGAVDAVACEGGKLLLANTFRYTSLDDAVYYLVAARRSLGIADADELAVAGDPALRPSMERLRRFVPRAMPMLPSSRLFALGRAMPRVPLDMLVGGR